MYKLFLIKRVIEDIFMYPLILLGRLIGMMSPLKKEYETFYFFPFYHIGGAEKVHANISKATGNGNCIIFFTKKSQNDLFYKEFEESGCDIRDISRYTGNKWIYFVNIIYRGILSYHINRQKKQPIVFNGQCNFGYKISPWIRKTIPQIELIHSLCSFSYIRIPFLPFITHTVMISTIRIEQHLELYKRFSIPLKLGDRIQFILNGISLLSNRPSPREKIDKIIVLYVGRGTSEKRVHLIAEVAKQISIQGHNIEFQFLGEVGDAIPNELKTYCNLWGNQSDQELIDNIYSNAHILILVSDTEGFPMVIMEAMAKGLAIISTGVGEIPLHVRDGINGFLVEPHTDEKAVIAKSNEYILYLYNNPDELKSISAKNLAYAYENFGLDRFDHQYRELFTKMRSEPT